MAHIGHLRTFNVIFSSFYETQSLYSTSNSNSTYVVPDVVVLCKILDGPLFAVIWLELTLNGFQGVVGGPAADIGAFEVDEILLEVNTFYFC